MDIMPLKKRGLFKAKSLKGGRSGLHTLEKGGLFKAKSLNVNP